MDLAEEIKNYALPREKDGEYLH